MAVINYFDTPLSKEAHTEEIDKKISVKKLVEKYIKNKNDVQTFEVYNTKTKKTSHKAITATGYKVATIVNGEEKDLEYVIQKDDVVSVVFVPQNQEAMGWITTLVSVAMVVVGIVACATGAGAIFGVPMIIGGVMGTVTGVISLVDIYSKKNQQEKNKNDSSSLSTDAALQLKGAGNALIKDQRFPFIFGKIAVNPYIYGSPFHETFTKTSGKHESQYMTALYCVGYAPLKLTDFKIAETVLCYNRPRADVPEEADNPTVLHGHIDSHVLATEYEQSIANQNGYYLYVPARNAYVKSDPQPTSATFKPNTYYKLSTYIPQKWKNNDIQIEILQAGTKGLSELSDIEKYGTLYNKTVIEDSIDANVLFIHDEDLSAAAEKSYKGVAIPKGYRTNSVRLSQNNPSHLEVELDFSSSIYRARQEKSGNTSKMVYYDIPVRFAVQWRPVKKDNAVSDAEQGSYGGWRTFDYLKLGDDVSTWQTPKAYTAENAFLDMNLNAGASTNYYSDSEAMYKYAMDTYYSYWYNERRSSSYNNMTLYSKDYNRVTGYYVQKYSEAEKQTISSEEARKYALDQCNEFAYSSGDMMIPGRLWIPVSRYDRYRETLSNGYTPKTSYNAGWIGEKVFTINEGKNYNTGHSPSDFDGNERLYVFSKDFTPEESKEILESDADYVEVRVIRLTPCYLDQNGSNSEDYGDFSYQDLCKWSTLRTTCYDKDAYKKAIKTNMSAKAQDYPLRPIRDEDLEKFTFIALRLKQDVAETGGSSLQQLRCLAQSFSPKYSETDKCWYPRPEDLTLVKRYYQKQKDENGEWQIIELTHEQYVEKIFKRETNLFSSDNGNNYTKLIANDIFTDESLIETAPISKYQLLPKCEEKYLDTNTASSVMLAILGSQNGNDAKDYNAVDLTSATELYEFCKDVTDGTPDKDSPDGLLHIKYSCNGIISQETKLSDVLQKFLATGRAQLKRSDENKYEFLIGKKVPYPTNILNSKNIISKSNTRSFNEMPSGFQTTFPDENDDYTQNPLYIMDKGENWAKPSKYLEQISIPYVTNHNQLWSLGCYNLAGRVFQRDVCTVTVGKMGLSLSIGNLMLVQNDSLLVGTDYGGRIVKVIENDNKIYGIIVNEPYEYTGELDENNRCVQGISIVQPDKYGPSRVVTLRLATPEGNGYITSESLKVGLTDIVAFAHPVVVSEDGYFSEESITEDGEFVTIAPKEGDLVAFGLLTKITEKWQITQIKPSGSNKFSLSLVPYNEQFFNYGSEIPVFNPQMTVSSREEENVNFVDYATKADIAENKASSEGTMANPSVDLTTSVDITMCKAVRDGIMLACDVYSYDETSQEKVSLTPLEITWKIVREDVSSTYSVSDPQPASQEELEAGIYYIKEGNVFKEAETFSKEETYYTANVTIVNTPVVEAVTNEPVFSYMFDRTSSPDKCGGYPECSDLLNFKISATAKLTVSSKTSDSYYTRIDLSDYGTWIPQSPIVNATIQDRSVILTFEQPASSRVLYDSESLSHRIQIRRAEEGDTEPYAEPDLTSNAYAIFEKGVLIKRNESSYRKIFEAYPQPTSQEELNKGNYLVWVDKDVSGKLIKDYQKAITFVSGCTYFVTSDKEFISGNQFTQTLPLREQGSAASRSTTYQYRVRAESVSGALTGYSEIQVTALVTNLRDIVRANLTEKESYIENLSAISANLGEITDGSIKGSETNYWTLTTQENATTTPGVDNKNYQGAFRVGGTDQYLLCKPIIKGSYPKPIGYEIKFKVGNFEVSSEASNINGELIVQENSSALDRTRITPDGTYYEHRETESSEWFVVDQMNTSGAIAPAYKAEKQIVIGNFTQNQSRTQGHDIGRAFLSNAAKVYHFDSDVYDQKGTDDLVIDGEWQLKGKDDSNGIDYTPAILAVAPYSTLAKSITGQISIAASIPETLTATIDFWQQYLYAESQELINVGTQDDKIILQVVEAEPVAVSTGTVIWYNDEVTGYTESLAVSVGDKIYEEPAMNTPYGDITGITLSDDSAILSIEVLTSEGTIVLYPGTSEMNYETWASEEIWGEKSCLVNRADFDNIVLTHKGQTQDESVYFRDLGLSFINYKWYHIGAVLTETTIKLFLNDIELSFARFGTTEKEIEVKLNSDKTSVIIDELYLDLVAETLSDFSEQTVKRIPFAKLSYEEDWFILDAKDTSKVKSNILNLATPVGTILSGLYAEAPTGFLLCNGTEVAIADYPELYEVIGSLDVCKSETEGMFKLPVLQGDVNDTAVTYIIKY